MKQLLGYLLAMLFLVLGLSNIGMAQSTGDDSTSTGDVQDNDEEDEDNDDEDENEEDDDSSSTGDVQDDDSEDEDDDSDEDDSLRDQMKEARKKFRDDVRKARKEFHEWVKESKKEFNRAKKAITMDSLKQKMMVMPQESLTLLLTRIATLKASMTNEIVLWLLTDLETYIQDVLDALTEDTTDDTTGA